MRVPDTLDGVDGVSFGSADWRLQVPGNRERYAARLSCFKGTTRQSGYHSRGKAGLGHEEKSRLRIADYAASGLTATDDRRLSEDLGQNRERRTRASLLNSQGSLVRN